jgi:hypothetical protein
MLVIRQEQLDVFELEGLRDCAEFVTAFVRKEVPEAIAQLSPSTLESRVLQGIRNAQEYELESYADVATFVTFLFTTGPEFYKTPFFQSVLTDADLKPEERMTALVELATELDWMEADDQNGQGTWCANA